jgi:hypothetical protein
MNITAFPVTSATDNLAAELKAIVYKYTGILTVAAVIGCIEVVKHDVLKEQSNG